MMVLGAPGLQKPFRIAQVETTHPSHTETHIDTYAQTSRVTGTNY